MRLAFRATRRFNAATRWALPPLSPLRRALKRVYLALPDGIRMGSAYMPSLHAPDVFELYAREDRDVFFVQIGAADGVQFDPLRACLRANRWPGIMVEPVKSTFDGLRANYPDHDNIVFVNAAISNTNEERKLYRLRKHPRDAADTGALLNSFSLEVLLQTTRRFPDVQERIFTERVRCMTLARLIAEHNVEKIDVLVIDTEGHDFEILKQLDFARFKPAIIMFEHMHLDDEAKGQAILLLRRQGYSLFHDRLDIMAVNRKPLIDRLKRQARRL